MLEEYKKKRNFNRTTEPPPEQHAGAQPLIFVVQKHSARRLHYDFRLELDGVLKSWALPKGPSLDPAIKRLAVMVEDHPLDYRSFEGTIPEGEYGAGQVIVWDEGSYSPEKDGQVFFDNLSEARKIMSEGLAEGKISLSLRGHKLQGSWALVKIQHKQNDWLLIKHRDEFAGAERDILEEDSSVFSGLSIDDLKSGKAPTAIDPPDISKIPGVDKSPFPSSSSPMLATLASDIFTDSNWIFEPKLDGYRTLALINEGKIKLISRHGLDVTTHYPHIVESLLTQQQLVLDGEIVALDEGGRPCFQCLQQHLKPPSKADAITANAIIQYYVFDILYLNGYDLRSVPLDQRKKLLEQTLNISTHIHRVDYFTDGRALYEASIAHGLEGIMAKRKESVYESGQRSKNWLKIKKTLSDEFVVGGFTQGMGNRADSFGALLLGSYNSEGNLEFTGHVGSGFDYQGTGEMRRRLDKLKSNRNPFTKVHPLNAPVTWVRPELVVEIKYSEWTNDGYLRHPVFLRVREDKAPDEVHRIEVVSSQNPVLATKDADPSKNVSRKLLEQLANPQENFNIEVGGYRVALTHLDKELWPPTGKSRAVTKRDLLVYFTKVSPFLLPHLHGRPLTLSRFPHGIQGQQFYQKHLDSPTPEFVTTVLISERAGISREYLVCNNLATLIWLGQMADLELHTWFSRIDSESADEPGADTSADTSVSYPDFIVFDMDPYVYSGKETHGAEPELNRKGFTGTCEAAKWVKESLDSLSLHSFIKTSGRTGLHIYVPILRQFDFSAVHAAAKTIALYVLQQHPEEITTDWAVDKRTGKIFIDYNQNVRGKTLASVYSPRPAPEATVSTPLNWDELGKVYPTDFTILTVPERLQKTSDLWADILNKRGDLKNIVNI